jgi:hypothetical protein
MINPYVFRKRINIEVPITNVTEAVEKVLEEKKFQKLVKSYFLSSKGIITNEFLFENTFYRDFLTHILLDKLCKPLMNHLIDERKNSGLYTMITRILGDKLLGKFVGISCIVQSVSGQDIQLNLKESLKNLIDNISEKEVFREYDFLICACEIINGRLYQDELENLRKPIKDLFSEDENMRRKAIDFFQDTLTNIKSVRFRKRAPEREFVQIISERIRFMLSLRECLISDEKEFFVPLDYNFKITNFLEDGEINNLREIIAKIVPVAADGTNINDEFVKKTSLVNMRDPLVKQVFPENLNLRDKIIKLTEYYKQQLVKYQKEGEQDIRRPENDDPIKRHLVEVIESIVTNKLFRRGVSIKEKGFHPVKKLLSSSLKILLLSVVVLILIGAVVTVLILELYNIRLINRDFIRDIAFYLSIAVMLIFLVVILVLHGSQRKFLINKLIPLREECMIRRIDERMRKEIFSELIQLGSVRESLKNSINLRIRDILNKEEITKEIIYDTIYLIEKEIYKRSGGFQSSYKRDVFDAYIDFKKNLQRMREIKESSIKNALDILLDSHIKPFDIHEEVSIGKKIILENNIQRTKKRTKKDILVSDQSEVIKVYEKLEEIPEEQDRDLLNKEIGNRSANFFPIFVHTQKRNIYILKNEPQGEIKQFSVQRQGRYIVYPRKLVERKILRLISFLNFLNPISYFGFDITYNFIKPSLIRLKRILEGKEILLHDFSFMKLSVLNNDHYTEVVHNFMYKIMKEKLRFFLTRDNNYGFYIPKFFENAQIDKIYRMVYNVVEKDLQDLQIDVINDQSENKPFLTSYILNTINNIPLGNEGSYSRYQLNKKFSDLQNTIFRFIYQQEQLNRYDRLTYKIEFRPFSIDVDQKITLLIRNGNINDKLLKFRKVSLAVSVVSGIVILSLVIDYNIRARIKIPKYLYIIYYSLLVSVITILLITDSFFFMKLKEGTQLTIRGISYYQEIIDNIAQGIKRQYFEILSTYFFIYQELGINLLQTTYVKENQRERFLLYMKKRLPVIVTRYLEPLFAVQWHVLLGDLNFEYDINETRKIYSTFKEIVFDYLRNYEFYKNVTLVHI